MDLIKKLGGYEKARAMRDSNIDSFDGDASGVRIHYMGDCFYQEDLDLSLLKYRRQHNIFEVGDPVVMRGTSHYDICEFVEASTVLPMYILKDENGCKFGINKKCVDHATDEEIAAGHRL